ncbi:MAG: hypothetical protein QM786_11870 [Breznakibacter sp.]
MKTNVFLLSCTVALATMFGSCSQDLETPHGADASSLKAATAVNACGCERPFADTITLPNVISTSMTLNCSNLYLLNGKTFVSNNATLTIPAGTQIEGVYNSDPLYASALIITRGSKIIADGEECCPIVFTVHNALPNPADNIGRWGGLVILGNAQINQSTTQTIEGIGLPQVPTGVDITYGTYNSSAYNTESSGILRYVRVEYAGASISTDNELNSFTFGGVGSGTTLEYLQAYYGADDAFEFFGGTVNAKYLLATTANDDAFDFDFGYRGKLQFLVAVLDPAAPYSANANGIECDNDGSGSSAQPYTRPIISNLTIVGTSTGATTYNPSTNIVLYGTHFRRSSRFALRNSVVYGYNTTIYLNGSGVYNYLGTNLNNTLSNDSSYFAHNVVGKLSTTGALWNNTGWTPNGTNSLVNATTSGLGILYPFNTLRYFDSSYKGLRAYANPILTGANFDGLDGFFDVTTYKGALSNDNYWIAGCWVKTTPFPLTW